MGRLRIPYLIDLLRTDDPAAIKELAQDKRLDRAFTGRGGLLNRMLIAQVRRVLALEGSPLPSVAPRGDAERARVQAELQTRLDAAASAGSFDAESVTGIARAVRGLPDAPILAHAVQQAVGRLFAADYQASAETWAAAALLDRAAHSKNPLASLIWRVTGRVTAAQRLLGEKVHDDRAGVHATGIAVHNLVRGFELMRSLFAYPNTPDRTAGASVVARCVKAPESVLREAVADSPPGTDAIRPATLVVLDLGRAQVSDGSAEIAFMAGSWSQCPASAWVPALIRAVWEHALTLPAPPIGAVGGSFRLDVTRTEAARKRTTYRRILGAAVITQALAGLVMLAAPAWVAHVLAVGPAAEGVVRVWGFVLLVVAALYMPGWIDPIYQRWPNVVAILGRCVGVVLYLLLGGGFLWFAVFDAGFAVALSWTYAQAIRSELMTRP